MIFPQPKQPNGLHNTISQTLAPPLLLQQRTLQQPIHLVITKQLIKPSFATLSLLTTTNRKLFAHRSAISTPLRLVPQAADKGRKKKTVSRTTERQQRQP
jgi:hypothetical protein